MTKGDDWTDDPGFREFAEHVLKETLPNMKESAMFMTIAPLKEEMADVRQAVEIGMAIMLDKPLIVIVPPGRHIAQKLVRIADHVITADITTEAGREHIAQAIKEVTNQ